MSTDVFVMKFTHLKNMPREKEALQLLQRIASLVKPIMRKHGWRLPVLAEFFPENPGLLGLNINGGQKICIRLRPYFDKGAFLQEHELIGTMLHELTHNVHGPHDQSFYSFLSKLEDEYDALQRSGYAGEGFFSPGQRVGQGTSHNLPPHLARTKAAAAAEQRLRAAGIMQGSKTLGGRRQAGKTLQQLAAEAAERRVRDEKSCASGHEAYAESERAARDGVEIISIADEDSDPEIIILDGPPDDLVVRKTARSTLIRQSSDPAGPSRSSNSATRLSTCPACTYDNPMSAKSCELCDTPLARPAPKPSKSVPKPTIRSPAAPSPQGWTCGTYRAELSTEKSEADEDDEGKRGSNEITFQQWMDKSGHLFRDPLPGRPNWLGRVPFPMNPTFKPPTPMSDQRRNDIFATHIKNPEVWTVRKLSEHYNVAMKRIEAIIRLKSLEVKWKAENRPLRLNFQAGMESALGIKAGVNNHVASRLQLVQLGVDETSEDSSVPLSERGIHKIWWEDVKEGEEPIVGPRLVALAEEAAKKLADTQAATAEFAAAHSRVVEPTVEGRAPTVFVDVGTRFMNLKEEAKRQKASQARQRLKAKKRSRQTA